MRSRLFTVISLGLALAIFSPPDPTAHGDDWPQWRGPHRDGISAETGMLTSWGESGPKLVWTAELPGGGYSTPSVADGKLFVLVDKENEEFAVAVDVKTGEIAWKSRLGKVGINMGPQYPGTRSTPTVDGGAVYCLGSDGDLVCLAAADGQERWRKQLRDDYSGQHGQWAYSESPLVDGKVLVCTPGGAKSTVVALDKTSGETIWESASTGKDQAGYASPMIVESGKTRQYVLFLQSALVGVDSKSGDYLWRYENTIDRNANIFTPIIRDDLVFSASGRRGGGLVKLTTSGEEVSAEEVYFTPKILAGIGGAVLIGDHLYGATGQTLACAEFATGNITWQDRSVCGGGGFNSGASVCSADGLLFVRGFSGAVALVKATPEGYQELGRFDQPNRSKAVAWQHPILANGKLYLRDQTVLLCYQVAE